MRKNVFENKFMLFGGPVGSKKGDTTHWTLGKKKKIKNSTVM